MSGSIKFIQNTLSLEYPPTTGKSKMKNDKEGKTIVKKKDRSNLLSDDLMKNVKTIMIGTRADGTAMSRRIGISIGK